MGVAAHSVSEQMIDDIASVSDAIESMPAYNQKLQENGINWEEFYDAAFPPKSHAKSNENAKGGSKKAKTPKKRMDFKDDIPADEPMTVKPVMLGDDELLPYDRITLENQREEAEAKAEIKNTPETKPAVADTKAAQLAAEVKTEEENPAHDPFDFLPEMQEQTSDTEVLDSVEDTLSSISEVVSTVSIEEILAAVERQRRDSVSTADAVKTGAEISTEAAFSLDTAADDDWHEIIPSRETYTEQKEETDKDEGASLLSSRLMQSYMDAEEQTDDNTSEPPELENIETVDLNQFLRNTESKPEEADEIAEPVLSFEKREEPQPEFVPEVIIDSAELEKETSVEPTAENPVEEEPAAPEQPEELPETPEPEEPEAPQPEAPQPEAPQPEAPQPEAPQPEAPQPTEAPETSETPVNVFVEEVAEKPDVEIIIADLEDEIFAEERLIGPESKPEEETKSETGIEIEDKIEKIAEAAEVAEVFRQENEDVSPEEAQTAQPDIFSVSIDDVTVTPEVRTAQEEEIREYTPREKTRESDENLFESVLIVDENPSIIDKEASSAQDDTLFLHLKESSENPTAVFKLPEGPIVFPTDIDDAEFQEQWLDEDEDGDDMASRNKRTRRRISAFIGAVALLFALMILFSAVKTVVSGFNSIGSTSEKKTEYTEFISPVVVNDPMPFESVEKADNNMLLKSSIWQALRKLDETEGYEHVSDATNKIVLPAENVEDAAKELFGNDVKLNMNVLSEYDGSALYYYDSIYKTFHITRSGITGPSAVITKIAQKSDYISLVVGYVQPEEMSLTSSESSETECYKFMEYVLALNSDGSYYISSIRNYVEE